MTEELQSAGGAQTATARSRSTANGSFKAVLQNVVAGDRRKQATSPAPASSDPVMSAMDTYLSVDKIDDTNLFPESGNVFPSTGFKTDMSAITSDRNSSLRQMSDEGRLHGTSGRWNSNAMASNKPHNGRSYKQASYSADASSGDDAVASSSANLDKYDSYIKESASNYGLDPALIKAVIVAESGGNASARSRSGAKGLMQLMPSTAAGLGVTNSYDPRQNIAGGSRYLRQLLDKYDGNVHQALAAYNWGMGNLDRRPDKMPQQTKNYVAKVEGYYRGYSENSTMV
ncbi:lytic transglycosylase domain-containing protein [Candidatus Magnetominusculus dajiuhuensis]|uniref:lytic transglycosylase domain-containing protein n=1 Tax=Candidatus Magnetominusculus dajiuhuensis TaxID=3137712 RepID=UPI003B434F51